jgi:hypothetical protein
MRNEFRKIDYWSLYSPGKEDNVKEFELFERYLKRAFDHNPNSVAVEVGSFHGFSTACAAQYYPVIAMDLWSVDDLSTHPGAGEFGRGHSESWKAFQKNMENLGLNGRVFPVCSTTEFLDYIPNLNAEIAFIDGCHESPFPYEDAKRISRHITQSGFMVFHDAMRGYVEEFETDMNLEDSIGHGWGYPPMDRMQFDPWAGVAEGILKIISEGEWESVDKAHGMMVLRRLPVEDKKSIFRKRTKK